MPSITLFVFPLSHTLLNETCRSPRAVYNCFMRIYSAFHWRYILKDGVHQGGVNCSGNWCLKATTLVPRVETTTRSTMDEADGLVFTVGHDLLWKECGRVKALRKVKKNRFGKRRSNWHALCLVTTIVRRGFLVFE